MNNDIATRLSNKLWKRANHLLELANLSLDKGFYDVSCSVALKAAKLALISLNLVICDKIPRTSSLKQLFSTITQNTNENIREIIIEFMKKYRKDITRLESSDTELVLSIDTKTKEQATHCISIAYSIMKLIHKILEAMRDDS
ncbi:MAG: hypothetical protein DRO15_03310 [Thermoprotei archaeon]|nr:MAG: hypothetical protein DRO15_03310 [Thermoprotei archaeon]